MNSQLLNQSQKRSLTVTLRLLEERLAEVERLLTVNERGVLYERVARFTPRQSERMRSLIAELREAVLDMTNEFQLERERQNPARRIVGLLGITWESLEELRAKSLKAYGAVDPRLPGKIDPWAERLTQLTLALQRTASRAPEDDEKVWGG